METKNYYHKESIDTAASSPFHSRKVPKEKEIPKISLSKHFSNSKFQEKLKIENKVAMYKLKNNKYSMLLFYDN